MRALLVLLVVSNGALAIGCEGSTRASIDPVQEPVSARVALGAEAQRVYERSLVRDPAPSCAALTDGLTVPTAALLEVAERVQAPPMSGMRAATCLVSEHAREIEPVLLRWVRERETMGFGLLVLDHLDSLDVALAERLRDAALAGEFPDAARRRIARSSLGQASSGEPPPEQTEPGAVAPR